MSLLRKRVTFESESGYFAVEIVRLPLKFFSRTPYRFYFKPSFSGAMWHRLDPRVVDLDTLLEADNAYAAMAYLRSTAV